jgi:methyltransferase-like protein
MGEDVVGREQYLDFLANRTFRRTLLCHADIALHREPRPEQVSAFSVVSCAACVRGAPDLRSERAEEFRAPNGVGVTTGHAVSKAAFVVLEAAWPRAMPFDVLLAEARGRLAGDAVVVQETSARARDNHLLAECLLKAFGAGVVELHSHVPALDTAPGERPRATALGRLQAARGLPLTNLRHEVVPLDDLSRQLLVHLDGTRDRAVLLELLLRQVTERGLVVQQHGRPITEPDRLRTVLADGLEANLRALAHSGLFMG